MGAIPLFTTAIQNPQEGLNILINELNTGAGGAAGSPLPIAQGGTGASTAATAIANLGGLAIANNLSDLASASAARVNLGLGSLAVLNTVNNSNWSGTVLSVLNGGTGSNLSATGGTSQVLKQTSVGGVVTVGQLAASDLSNSTTGSGSVVLATSPTLVTPNLGTPTTLIGTNISGTAPNLTAGTVTTNANLTGAVTSTGNATLLGSFTSAQLATALTDETGTGSAVFATSPTLVTPALGTPTALVGTNITGTAAGLTAGNVITNANLTGAVTSVGNATSLGSFTSAQLATALTDETGSGANVFATSPILVTPNLGTPSTLVGTNITGTASALNIGGNAATASAVAVSGITGLGIGVAVFLATPSSANLAGAVTDETGSGALVFANSPALTGTATGVNLTLSGNLTVNGNTAIGDASTDTFIVNCASPTFSTSNQFVIGNSSPISTLISAGLQVIGTSSDAYQSLQRYSADTAGCELIIAKSRGATKGTFTIIQNGDNLGSVRFVGSNGTAYDTGAQISAAVDGTPGVGDMPGRLSLMTTPDGGNAPAENVRIDNTGAVYFPRISTTVSTANTFINIASSPANSILRNSSSGKIKTNVEDIDVEHAENIFRNLRPVWFRSLCKADNKEWSHYGWIAEEVFKVDPRLAQIGYSDECFYEVENPDGSISSALKQGSVMSPMGVQADRIIPPLLLIMRRQEQQICDLLSRVETLENGVIHA